MADDTTSDTGGDAPEQPGQGAPSGGSADSEREPLEPVSGAPSSADSKPIPYFSNASGSAVPGPSDDAVPDASAPAGEAAEATGPAEQGPAPAKKGGLFGFLKRDKGPRPETQPAEVAPTEAQPREIAPTAAQPGEIAPTPAPWQPPLGPAPPEPGAAAPAAEQPRTNADAAAVLAGSAATAWAAADAHGTESTPLAPAPAEPPAPEPAAEEPQPPFTSAPPIVPFIPAEKPGLFGFLKRNKQPEPEPGPWLPPETNDTPSGSASGWGALGAGATAAGVAAARESAPLAPGESAAASAVTPAVDAGSTQPAEPVSGSAADQMTQLLPTVPAAADASVTTAAPAPAPVPEPLPALGPMVPTGSRIVIVISRSASPVPMGPGVAVPKVVGQMQGDALGQLQANGLSAQVFNDFSNEPRGEIVAQLPQGGQAAPAGSEVVLLVSSGPAPVASLLTPLPDVVGLTEADALSKLQLAGLSPQIVRTYSATVPLGVVIEQLPSARSMAAVPRRKRSLWWLWLLLAFAIAAAAGGGIYYYINRTAIVPRIVGLPQAQAEQALAASGFKVGSVSTTQTLSASQVGSITSQTPEPGTTQKLTDPVDIVVSGGQLLFAVPNVVGKPSVDAQNAIQAASLQVSVTQSYSATAPVGAVMFQSPIPGEKVPTKTTVGIVVSLGVQNVTVPGIVGRTQKQAEDTLKSVVLSSQAVVQRSQTGVAGTVYGQFPNAGESVRPGTVVGILVSAGPSSATTPTLVPVPTDLVGKTESQADTALKSVNLTSSPIQWRGTGKPKGIVVGQLPESGEVLKNSSVMLFVSNGQ